MADRFYSMIWQEQQDRSVAADFLERVVEQGGSVSPDAQGVWWMPRVPEGMAELYGVTLRLGQPRGLLKPTRDFRPPGVVQGTGERLTLDPRDSDVYTAAAFLLDRVEGVAWAADGTVLLDSPYSGGSTARARNFAEQFGLTVILNDDPRLKPKWELRRPRLGVTESGREVVSVLNRYHVPWVPVEVPKRPEFDTVIVAHAGIAEAFRKAGGKVIVAGGDPVTINGQEKLTPATAKLLLREVYLGSARAV